MRPEPCGLWTRSALPSSSSKIDFAIPQVLAAQLPASVRGSRSWFPIKSSFYFLHATVQGHSSPFLQKPLNMGLDGVENVMCKY